MNVIAHNLLATNAQRQLNITTRNRAKTTEKLSSGYRINRAADDAAGLSISEKMRKQARGLNRGVANTQDGISLCQVADGALAEVNDMLHRLTELSVQSANGTNSASDRAAIQQEVNQILCEIDRIGETTTFNGKPLFTGHSTEHTEMVASELDQALMDADFSDFRLSSTRLGSGVFGAGSRPDDLKLSAEVTDPVSAAYQTNFSLIFGNGSTSSSSFKLLYNATGNTGDTKSETIAMASLTPTNFQYNAATDSSSRVFNYTNADGVNIDITQTIKVNNGTDASTERYYEISYAIANNSQNAGTGAFFSVDVDFMFHADTAYNNNDVCEGYYVNGTRVDTNRIYSPANSAFTNGLTDKSNVINSMISGFSIIDTQHALAFSEKIKLTTPPTAISFGFYDSIKDWSYYNGANTQLGQNSIGEDLGFSLLYHNSVSGNQTKSFGFSYGIADTAKDANLNNIVTQNNVPKSMHTYTTFGNDSLWIQSGADTMDGIVLHVGDMNTSILGIREISLMSEKQATDSIRQVDKALAILSAQRSRIGAQQNRLEHTVANESNVVENTTAAESRIRDTDMAKEMMHFSMQSILEQAGQSMLSQASRSAQDVLSLLQ